MQPYQPQTLPLKNLDYKRLFGCVGEANFELATYDGLLQGIVNPQILLSPLTTQEAVLSSRIEGTLATLNEVLEHDAGVEMDEAKRNDIQEIRNYRSALMLAKSMLANRPITLHLLREAHKILLSSVRGKDKHPGEFRTIQNWIGKPGSTIEEATFIPPSPLQMSNYLDQWQKYAQSDDIDGLLQLAVVHAQFELIHPFEDGNGRIGRLLIPLFLYQKQMLSMPMFYLSAYLETNREEYYAHLQGISQNDDWNSWIEFFLKAIIAQAKENSSKARQTMLLYEKMKDKITNITHSQYSIQILDAIFDRPIFRTSDLVRITHITKPTIMNLLRQLKDACLLRNIRDASGSRPAIMVFPELLEIAENKKIF
ncbi:MAG: Fic family protein [Sedimentisphaerales bacterium]|nr:Fic family protein [Sedimentisphaerales bacterium]